MACGKALSDDLRGVILYMAQQMDIASIVRYTGQKKRTVERVLSDFRHKGIVTRQHMATELRGTKRSLTAMESRVSSTDLLAGMV
jgi:DNA-binding IclR family transcriptional regulator